MNARALKAKRSAAAKKGWEARRARLKEDQEWIVLSAARKAAIEAEGPRRTSSQGTSLHIMADDRPSGLGGGQYPRDPDALDPQQVADYLAKQEQKPVGLLDRVRAWLRGWFQ